MDPLSKITRGGRDGKQVTVTIPASLAELIPEEATHVAVGYHNASFILRPVAFSPLERKENT